MSKYDQLKQILNAIATQLPSEEHLKGQLAKAQREILKLETQESKPEEQSMTEYQEAIVALLQNKFMSDPRERSAETITMLKDAIEGLERLRSHNETRQAIEGPSERAINEWFKQEIRPGGSLSREKCPGIWAGLPEPNQTNPIDKTSAASAPSPS